MSLPIGGKAPDFDLPGTDGNNHSLQNFADKAATVIIFSCNHCPYVVMYEDRMIELQRDYADKDVAIIAINSNNPVSHPADSFDNMKVRAEEKGFNFPYVLDGTQQTAREYRATRTPEVFVVGPGGAVVYHGRIDDNAQDASAVERHDLREALDQLLAGEPIGMPDTAPIGCTIKWK